MGPSSTDAETTDEVVMFTTAGLICVARSANVSGAPSAAASIAGVTARARPRTAAAAKRCAAFGRAIDRALD
jgi:hypothetical protein